MTALTKSTRPGRHTRKRRLIIMGVGAFSLIAALFVLSMVGGYGLNVRALGSAVVNVIRAVANHSAVVGTSGNYQNVVFLHHSVGRGLIEQGTMRELFTAAGYQFWDHDYNAIGLTDPAGHRLGYNYVVPADNTDPAGIVAVFSQPAYGLPFNTFSALLQHEVIIFKSCFPASDIVSDEQLRQRKDWYLQMRAVMDQHPDKFFVVVTQPPLNPAKTSAEAAVRARSFANWLKSAEFLNGHPNIVTFDLFDQLAEGNPQSPDFNMLRQDYREGADSHPTRTANEKIGPQLVDFVINATGTYGAKY